MLCEREKMICKSGDMLKVVVSDHDSTRACLGDHLAGLSWSIGPKQTISFQTLACVSCMGF